MITNKDVTKILKAFKLVYYDKDEMDVKFDNVDKKFNKLQTSVDNYAKIVNNNQTEIKVLNHRVTKLEKPA